MSEIGISLESAMSIVKDLHNRAEMVKDMDSCLSVRGVFHSFLMNEDGYSVNRIEIVVDCMYDAGPCGYMSTECDRFSLSRFFDYIREEQSVIKELLTEELPFVDVFFLVRSDFLIPVECVPVHTGWHSIK
jgi:hypothetical protein